ncbi:MAG: bifunctional phosphoribosylaminoimidazolecarboxamide formyltransferase/IMP cyclohydrolase [Proteobacteria bacterium]|nr:bifunctional phosphoribosylaminoimidazolecarboxamide formyltransferase/IMP cyclohydrolase [Burkholderiales bacterium]
MVDGGSRARPRRRALLSVSCKSGVEAFAARLAALDFELVSTGGTGALLRAAGLPVIDVATITGFPEMLDGRVKTLHPNVHGAILARLDLPEHRAALAQAGMEPISLVVVNLYPFREAAARPGSTLEEVVEQIDIGGPAMVRAAAKNHAHVGVVVDSDDYAAIADELVRDGALGDATRFELARKAFSHTAAYDGAISNYLGMVAARGASGEAVRERAGASGSDRPLEAAYPAQLNLSFTRIAPLRYGENPHQSAAFYRDLDASFDAIVGGPAGPSAGRLDGTIACAAQRQGKELSYNNIADADAAWECVRGFTAAGAAVGDPSRRAACAIVKHANPCGVALGIDAADAYRRAFATDPTSAFGGIIAFNCPLDAMAAEALIRQFAEVVVAPAVTLEAMAVLSSKPSLRVLETGTGDARNTLHLQRIGGGLLVQRADLVDGDGVAAKPATQRKPDADELRDLHFAWQVVKFVKSNAIVFARDARTLAVGAGQMSRIDSVRIARHKAAEVGLDLAGACVASDAFFPFRDGLDAIVAAGARAVIQPGGSVRDAEVIAAADEQGVAMLFTGVRHFRH